MSEVVGSIAFADDGRTAIDRMSGMTQKIQLTATELTALQRSLTANGREQAWTFVVKSNWDPEGIQAQLADKVVHRDDPDAQKGSMKTGASPRIFIDAYIAVLKEAIDIIEAQQVEPVIA